MPNRLHLVDGTFELFRAHYGKRPDHTMPDGQPAKASLGVASSMLSLLAEPAEQVTHIAVAFDNPIESFRNDLFPGYKTGEGIDPVLRSQFDLVEEAVRAIGITVWSMDRWEADDAMATAAIKWASDFDQVRILTPDKDLGQVVQGNHIVQVDRIRQREIDEAALRLRRGVGPASIPDLLALIGDSADGIPGLPGFGEKSAATVLGVYPHIEDIPPDANNWSVKPRGADRLAQVLRENRKEALLYRQLATLALDVPLKETVADLAWQGIPRKMFEDFCQRVGSNALLSQGLSSRR